MEGAEGVGIGREKCLTGIEGLDSILGGGIPRNNTVLLTGNCGTGKTSVSLEYLLHGAIAGENGLYLSVTEPFEKLIANMIPYDFFRRELIKSGKLTFIDISAIYSKLGFNRDRMSLEDVDLLVAAIGDLARETRARRLVIDSITSVAYQLDTQEKLRNLMLGLSKMLSGLGTTSLLISELTAADASYSKYGVEEAIADGVILMGNLERNGDMLRTLQVIKMRGTSHSRAKYVLDLTTAGTLLVPLLKGNQS
ncbi:MAG: RAD55 family ATPase [Thermoplasmata archaeon]|uniref:Circadian clock protein KaiC n=1 Tax=Candidatus Sysuiplasma superficiale TaxID=2823368 RepID=A0A8J7YIM3_9ARCH|nr:circadian clock protein KaiC [Candidatus Sysuiplasma superficiale]MBX8643194.1 RAD55 family ATPase [Candidatus Sysuiplasma superficiale]